MVKCISLDGIDGAGKSALVEALSSRFNVATLPKFYDLGSVPSDASVRMQWFFETDDYKAMLIYAVAHRNRILLADDYKNGHHHNFTKEDDREKLIVMDRGVLSVEAFIYAVLRMSSTPTDQVVQFIADAFRDRHYERMLAVIDRAVLLAEDSLGYVEEVLKRRRTSKREEMLVRLQAEYYDLELYRHHGVMMISPRNSKEANVVRCVEIISGIEDK